VGSLSSNPQAAIPLLGREHKDPSPMRDGESEPTRSAAELIRDPVLRAAFLRAYRAWAKAQA
jgi:hypothetical protein